MPRGPVGLAGDRRCLFLFCFNSCIYNPLHAARRAMAAPLPLPSRGQRRVFRRYTHFLPRTSLRSYSEVSHVSFFPKTSQDMIERTKEKTKERVHSRRVGPAPPRLRLKIPRSLHPPPRPAKRNPPVQPMTTDSGLNIRQLNMVGDT